MIFKDKTYDILKWMTMIAIPACATAYTQLANILGWGYGEEVAEVAVIICTLLGTLLGISNYQYYQKNPKTPVEAYYDLEDLEVEEQDPEEGNG